MKTRSSCFEKYYKAGQHWATVLSQQENVEEIKNADSDLRIWMFSDEVLKKVCQRNRKRWRHIIRGLVRSGHWRHHPDIWPKSKASRQYHALKKSITTSGTEHTSTKRTTQSTETGSQKVADSEEKPQEGKDEAKPNTGRQDEETPSKQTPQQKAAATKRRDQKGTGGRGKKRRQARTTRWRT